MIPILGGKGGNLSEMVKIGNLRSEEPKLISRRGSRRGEKTKAGCLRVKKKSGGPPPNWGKKRKKNIKITKELK